MPVLVHEMHDRRVVHGVVAAFERHFLEVDAVGLGDGCDGHGIAGEAADVGVEARKIILQAFRRVALGIDRDEHHRRAVGIAAELAQDPTKAEIVRLAVKRSVRAKGSRQRQVATADEVIK
jgi:hypothetical protein